MTVLMEVARQRPGLRMIEMKTVIVGAGFGGLAAAALLARDGAEVTVLEKNEQAGGRASVHRDAGFTFDMGPSWYLMPDVFDRFFAVFGRKPADFFELKRLDPSYRIFFGNGRAVDIPSDTEKTIALFDTFEKDGGEKLRRYLKSAEEMYTLAMQDMLYRDYKSVLDFFSGRLLFKGPKLVSVFENLDSFVERYFTSDEAKKIVQYSIGFLGGAPSNTPALYHIMSHIDLTMGVFYPEGGIRAVVEAVRDLAAEHGAEFRFNEPATRIQVKRDRAVAVETAAGRYPADVVLVNADYPHAELSLLDDQARTYSRKYWSERVLAPSAMVLYLGLNRQVEGLAHHTLLLEKDWEKGFETLFDPAKAAWPESPSYYVNVPSKTDTTAAPPGGETLFVLVPLAPGLPDTPDRRQLLRDHLLTHLEATIGEPIRDAIVSERCFALDDFATRYNAYKGTALGLSHTLSQTALWRPAHRSKKVSNLYYSGQYTHPGIGVPMTLISSQIVAKEIAEEQMKRR